MKNGRDTTEIRCGTTLLLSNKGEKFIANFFPSVKAHQPEIREVIASHPVVQGDQMIRQSARAYVSSVVPTAFKLDNFTVRKTNAESKRGMKHSSTEGRSENYETRNYG